MQRVAIYFTKVSKLISDANYDLVDICVNASDEIKIHHFYNIRLGSWSRIFGNLWKSLDQLKELRMHHDDTWLTKNIEDLADFLRTKRNLKVFDYSGEENIDVATKVLRK